jgi:hypothetical protein
MVIASTAHAEFMRARRKAFWRRIAKWFTRADDALLSFDEVRRQLRVRGQHDTGFQEVPVDKIVGSVSRYRDFDRAFLPRNVWNRGKWESVDRALLTGIVLPPVELFKIGDTYFVKDGNQRVSVARETGQLVIDANVVELESPAPVSSAEDILDLIRDQDAVAFHERTGLGRLRPGARIDLTLPGQYEKLLEHIDAHRWYLGLEGKREIPYEEAVASWYDRVYLPTVEAIRSTNALRDFPDKTEADLYLWITEHHWYLHQNRDGGGHGSGLPRTEDLRGVIRDYVDDHSKTPLKRVARTIRRKPRP